MEELLEGGGVAPFLPLDPQAGSLALSVQATKYHGARSENLVMGIVFGTCIPI